jgi:beta-hydroxylase
MAGAGQNGRLYLTSRIWVPQRPLQRFNLWMADRMRRSMPPLPMSGEDAIRLVPELAALVQSHAGVRKEAEQIVALRERIPTLQDIHPRDDRISSERWLTYVMMLWGHTLSENLARCPETARAIRGFPRLHTALFSILEPRAEIPRHRGWAAGVVRCHYPLITPHDEASCWIDVDGVRLHWRESQPLLFDDTLEHEVHNETDEMRVVLIVDFEPRQPLLGWLYSRLRYLLVRRSEEIRSIARRSVVPG